MRVWVAAPAWNERALIVAQLDAEGYEARGFESLSELRAALALEPAPDLIILDQSPLERTLGKEQAIRQMAPEAQFLFVRRPVSVGEITERVRRILHGRA